LEESGIRAWYDRDVDVLYIAFRGGAVHEIIEAGPNVHLELDEKGQVVGMEIWNARRSGLISQVAKAIAQAP